MRTACTVLRSPLAEPIRRFLTTKRALNRRALAARIELASHTVADLDRRLNQVDIAIEEAARRGRTATALYAIEAQRKSRETLLGQRQREGVILADLQAERAALGTKGK